MYYPGNIVDITKAKNETDVSHVDVGAVAKDAMHKTEETEGTGTPVEAKAESTFGGSAASIVSYLLLAAIAAAAILVGL